MAALPAARAARVRMLPLGIQPRPRGRHIQGMWKRGCGIAALRAVSPCHATFTILQLAVKGSALAASRAEACAHDATSQIAATSRLRDEGSGLLFPCLACGTHYLCRARSCASGANSATQTLIPYPTARASTVAPRRMASRARGRVASSTRSRLLGAARCFARDAIVTGDRGQWTRTSARGEPARHPDASARANCWRRDSLLVVARGRRGRLLRSFSKVPEDTD